MVHLKLSRLRVRFGAKVETSHVTAGPAGTAGPPHLSDSNSANYVRVKMLWVRVATQNISNPPGLRFSAMEKTTLSRVFPIVGWPNSLFAPGCDSQIILYTTSLVVPTANAKPGGNSDSSGTAAAAIATKHAAQSHESEQYGVWTY